MNGFSSPIELWEIARCSSAAQHYFPGVSLSAMVCLDGGNTSDNAPDELLIAEATAFTSLSNHRMLSIGTGDSKWSVNPSDMLYPGILKVGINTIKIVFSAGVSAQIYKARKMLGSNHYYISPTFNTTKLAIDDVGNLPIIADAANVAIATSGAILDEFV